MTRRSRFRFCGAIPSSGPDDKGQSYATRAWNIATSIYYKARGIPWRPTDLPKNVCFVGISFHHMKKRNGHLVYASVAQAYSTDVQPFALKGANIDHDQRRAPPPYLNQSQARHPFGDVLFPYCERAGEKPGRGSLPQTTTYPPGEISPVKAPRHRRV